MNGKRFYRRRRATATAKRAPMRRRPRVAKPVTKMVKAIVKKEMNKEVENKNSSLTTTAFFYQNGLSTITSGSSLQIIPSIPQGTSESSRIGNNVTLKRFTLTGYMQLQGSGQSGTNPFIPGQFNVRLFIGRLKLTNSTPITSNYDNLLRTGSSTLAFNSNDGLSLCRGINTEQWTIFYDKIHKIGVSQPSNNAAIYDTLTGISNNDYKLSKIIRIDMTKWVKKKWIFSDSLTIPNNTGLYIFGGIVDSISSDYNSSNALVQMTFDTVASYEDA